MSFKGGSIRYFSVFFGILAILSVSACGGGGGGSDGGGNPNTPDQATGGIWIGTGTSDFEPGVVFGAVALSTDHGRFRFLSSESVQARGTISSNGTSLSGSVRAYAPLGFVFSNGSAFTNCTISGVIEERDLLTADYECSNGDRGEFSMLYDQTYDRDSSLALVEGDWSTIGLSLTFDSNGILSGSDNDGCLYGGYIAVIDSNYDMYDMQIVASNCGDFNGTYTGLATLNDTSTTNDTLSFQVDNNLIIVSDEIFRD